MAKRIKTDYPGVVYVASTSSASGKPEKVFYIVYRKNGKQIEEKVGRSIRDNMTAAKANRIRAERIEGRQLPNNERRAQEQAAKQAEAGQRTIASLWTEYDETKPQRACRSGDVAFIKRIPEGITSRAVDELTNADLEKLRWRLASTKSERTGKTISAQTQRHTLALLLRVLRWAEGMGYCDASKVKIKMPKVSNEKTEFMDQDQLAAYWAALDEEPNQNEAAFFRLALLTGVRKTALLNVRWDDVDLTNGFLTLRGEIAKSAKTQIIPLSAAAIDVLRSMERRQSPYLWPGRGDGPNTKCFYAMAKRLRAKAGLPEDFRPVHGLRHHFASHLASSGASLYEVSQLLTHSNVSITKRYAHLSDAALRRAVGLADSMLDTSSPKVSKISGSD